MPHEGDGLPPRAGLLFTPRQAQILALVASGLTDGQIATRLGLSPRTVRTHLDRVRQKHGLRNRAEAAVFWSRHQIPCPSAVAERLPGPLSVI
jgi:DNA-binding NarL/FixJ family response regulator